jgi:3-hydroxybutyryl-CoA dehydratase
VNKKKPKLRVLHIGEQLPVVAKTITQRQIDKYALVSGDHNPLHWDVDFASSTQFGGIIAHGMLTLAFVSEMMVNAFGRTWLETGTLKVKFKGAAFVGSQVETWGQVNEEVSILQCRKVVCSVGLRNRKDQQVLIVGTATVKLD